MIEAITKTAKQISEGTHEQVRPGMPVRISEAASAGDEGWQGDLGFVVANAKHPTWEKRDTNQLVPGNTTGSKHCVADPSTCIVLFPPEFSDDYEGLEGPYLIALEDTDILHPTHGTVTIPAGMEIQFKFQRNLDLITKQERRAID